jgi:hypothetical protein
MPLRSIPNFNIMLAQVPILALIVDKRRIDAD